MQIKKILIIMQMKKIWARICFLNSWKIFGLARILGPIDV